MMMTMAAPLPRLLLQDCIPPQANSDLNCADWLPDFVGFSWIAYGAGSSLVISMAPLLPSTKEEPDEVQPVLRQVLHTGTHATVACVRWAPRSSSHAHGLVAASAGDSVYMFGPEQSIHNRGLPTSWSKQNILPHTFQVLNFTWTESGDGLLSIGLEVNMWKRGEDVWCCLWKVPVAFPHSLAAATWSASGLAATSEGTSAELTSTFARLQNGTCIIWWWDSSGIQNTELTHPQKVTMVQWRPTNMFANMRKPVREALLTACQDGAVRLWIQIQIGRMKGDKTLKKDGIEKCSKPSFVVTAVIEMGQSLKGILGTNMFLTWVFKGNSTELGSVFSCKSDCQNVTAKYNEGEICEWILGLGADGSVALWAIFCLDDLYPPRFPRVLLWKQASYLVSVSGSATAFNAKPQTCLILMKAIAGRMGEKSPTSLDLFCKTGEGFFEWFRIWPPVSAVEGDSSKVSITGNANAGTVLDSSTASINSWGITSEHICTVGHVGSVLEVAIHPAAKARLAASLDSEGFAVIWSVSDFSNMEIALPTFSLPIWRPCGCITGQHKYKSIAWLPTFLSNNRTLLLLSHLHGIDCFLIAENKVVKEEMTEILPFSASFLSTIEQFEYETISLQNIWVLQIYRQLKCVALEFAVLGLGQEGSSLLSWKLDITTVADYKHTPNLKNGESKPILVEGEMIIKASSLRAKKFEEYERVLSLDIVPSWFCNFPQSKNMCMPIGTLPLNCAFDFVTGSVDGWLKLWRLNFQQLVCSMHSEDATAFQLVGGVKVCQNPVKAVAVASGGIKIAAISLVDSQDLKLIHIWDVETYFESGGFTLDEKISLPCSSLALAWLEIGNGHFFLGVGSNNDVLVYAQARESASRTLDNSFAGRLAKPSGSWFPFASASMKFAVQSITWGMNASLVVGMKDHLCIYSHKILLYSSQEKNYGGIPKFVKANDKALAVASSSRASSNSQDAKIKLEDRTDMAERFPFQNSCLSTILKESEKVSCPLPSYHPWAILYHLSVGNQYRARICIRHFMYHLKLALARPSKALHKDSSPSLLEVPRLHLSDYLTDYSDKWSRDSLVENSTSILNQIGFFSFQSDKVFSSSVEDTVSTTISWLEFLTEHLSLGMEQKGMKARFIKSWGCDVFVVQEVNLMMNIVHDCKEDFPLPDNEKIQFLAVLDLMVEMDSKTKSPQYASLDEAGKRYWLAVEYALCYLCRRTGSISDLEELSLGGKAMAWALQSDCKETLIDLCLADSLSWPTMRALGVGFWLTDIVQLRARMEKLARAKYLLRKNPRDCALLYVALKRQNVLMGLFKLSKEEKDKALVQFLARNFLEEKNQAAALKNAYVLLGKHEYELAAAFFLLGGDIKSAVGVCTRNLGDLQLAFVICRLKEGCGGEIERDLITNHGLPNAKDVGDSWLASLFQWVSGDRVKAMEELIGKLKISWIALDSSIEYEEKTVCLVSSEKVGTAFLDPDAGHYCLLLAAKASIRAAFGTVPVLALSKWLTSKTASALRRIGLPLEALEQFTKNSISASGLEINSAFDIYPTGGIIDMPSSDIKLLEDMPAGYISPVGALGILNSLKEDLASYYVSQLLQDHPHWSYESYFNSEIMGEHTISSNEHDRLLDESLFLLENKFSINIYSIIARLAIFAQHQNRLYLHCRLMAGLYLQTKYPEYLPKDLSGLFFANYILHKASEGLTAILVRRILSCHNLVIASCNSEQTACWLSGELQEIVLLAFDLRLLTAATLQDTKVNQMDIGQKRFTAFFLLDYIMCVASSWQGRRARELLMLISFIIQEPPAFISSCEIDKCIDTFCIPQNAETGILTAEVRVHISCSVPKALSVEDLWLVLGVSLWQKLLEYVRKKLIMVNESVSLESFSYVSPLSSPSKASCTIPCCQLPSLLSLNRSFSDLSNHMKEQTLVGCHWDSKNETHLSPSSMRDLRRLLKSLTCIYSGLCRQLAYYVRYSSRSPAIERLIDWIWDIQHCSMEALINSSTTSSPEIKLQNDDEAPRDQLGPFEELWELLVVRENLCCALQAEGVVRPTKRVTMGESGEFSGESTEGWQYKLGQSAIMSCNNKVNQPVKMIARDFEEEKMSLKGNCSSELSMNKQDMFYPVEKPKDIFHINGELFEAMCINSCCPDQVVIASNQKHLIYLDLKTGGPFFESKENLWSLADWPRNGWAKSESTPVPTFVSPGVGLGSKGGAGLGLGGATVGLGTIPRVGKDLSLGGTGYGIPGYAGIGSLGFGWEELEEFDGFVDPPATVDNISAKALASHPLRPLFLVGSSNTHVYLWEFGQASAIATYGVLPAANVPPPYALASVSAVKFDHYGHRFATAAVDGTVCTWQLEVGGRSNVRPIESHLCFNRHASDIDFMGASGGILAATGMSPSCYNLVIWDTLAPPNASCAWVFCHEGGAHCLSLFDHNVGGGSFSPLIVTGGKGGDVAIHDFRFIATGKAKHHRHVNSQQATLSKEEPFSSHHQHEQSNNGMLWYIPKAHSASITTASTIPGTPLFLTGSKDGDVKLWDLKKYELVYHWHKVHEKQMFLQHNSRGFGAVVQASVTSIQTLPSGFLTCGGDGMMKLFQYHYPGHKKHSAI